MQCYRTPAVFEHLLWLSTIVLTDISSAFIAVFRFSLEHVLCVRIIKQNTLVSKCVILGEIHSLKTRKLIGHISAICTYVSVRNVGGNVTAKLISLL
jgi:hypothetical protein